MVILILEAVPPTVRGEVTRWLSPLTAHVFIGRVSGDVRELLWTAAVSKSGTGRVIMAWSAATEQGFEVRCNAAVEASVLSLEGLLFFARRDAAWLEAAARFGLITDEVRSDIEQT